MEKEQELERIKVKIEDKERDNILKKNAIKGQQE